MNQAPVNRSATLLLLGVGLALGRSLAQMPAPSAANATQSPADAPAAQAKAQPAGPQVVYSRGLLKVTADNSSLNQILAEIARQTGMRITGTVREEGVYGTYGPAAPARVLASLLDGTSSNMLLRETSSSSPAELILTPRLAGPSPPQPAAPQAAAFAVPTQPPPAPVSPQTGIIRGVRMSPAEEQSLQQQNQQRIQQLQRPQQQQPGAPR
jgi:hypothetical protein